MVLGVATGHAPDLYVVVHLLHELGGRLPLVHLLLLHAHWAPLLMSLALFFGVAGTLLNLLYLGLLQVLDLLIDFLQVYLLVDGLLLLDQLSILLQLHVVDRLAAFDEIAVLKVGLRVLLEDVEGSDLAFEDLEGWSHIPSAVASQPIP